MKKKIWYILTILVGLTIGFTFAWWMWSTTEDQNTNVSLTVDGMTINYDAGDHISGANLIPIEDMDLALTNETAIKKTITVTAPMTTYLNLYMTLEQFPTALAEPSFMYEIRKGQQVILSGNFSELVQGDRIQLLNREVVGTETSTFDLYIWIDGTQNNPTTMMNQTFKFVLTADGTTDPNVELPKLDDSGANIPNVSNGLIPVMYSNNKWVKADTEDKDGTYKWYDYDAKNWANAVLVSSTNRDTYKNAVAGTPIPEDAVLAYYVWIPRYKYKVFNINKEMGTDSYDAQNTGIEIVFEEGTDSTGTIECEYKFETTDGSLSEICSGSNGDYYTHPAFTFGNTEVEGIWVSKFEISSSTPNTADGGGNSTSLGVRVKPGVVPWSNNNLSNFSLVIQNMDNEGNEYGLATNSESHMLKNIEWGAVVYLSQSNYGKCNAGVCEQVSMNSYYYYDDNLGVQTMTGCGLQSADNLFSGETCNDYTTLLGQGASTTGNIYGIYDMSGGAYEYVMGNMSSTSGTYTYNQSNASTNYTYSDDTAKYIDTYAYGTTNTDQNAYNRARLGDATAEVVTTDDTGWYDSYASFINVDNVWFMRGGDYNGNIMKGASIFEFTSNTGSNFNSNTTRSVLLSLS